MSAPDRQAEVGDRATVKCSGFPTVEDGIHLSPTRRFLCTYKQAIETQSLQGPSRPRNNNPEPWVPEGSLAGFFRGAFLRSGRPRGPGKAFKNVAGEAPHIF